MNVSSASPDASIARRFARALLWTTVITMIAVAVNVVGIYAVGSVDGWNRWLTDQSPGFFAWRLLVYAMTGYGWWWLRRRVERREKSSESFWRLRRAEIAAVLSVGLLEISALTRFPL